MNKAKQEQLKAALEPFLQATYQEVLNLERRIALLEAFLKELHTQTNGVMFEARTPLIWHWFWDSFEAAVVHVAAFSKRAYDAPRGTPQLFHELRQVVGLLKPGIHETLQATPVSVIALSGDPPDEEAFAEELLKGRKTEMKKKVSEAFTRLFQRVPSDRKIGHPDVNALQGRFVAKVSPLHRHRNFVAHRYETSGTTKLQADITRAKKVLALVGSIISDVRYIVWGYGFTFTVARNLDRTCRDLVDQMLYGDINSLTVAVGMTGLYWKKRDDLGARLPPRLPLTKPPARKRLSGT